MNGPGLLAVDASSQPHNCGFAYFEVLTGRLEDAGTLDNEALLSERDTLNPLGIIAGGARSVCARLPVQFLAVDYPAAFSYGGRRGNMWSLMRNHQAVGCIIGAAGLPFNMVYPFFSSKHGDKTPELTKRRVLEQYSYRLSGRVSEHVVSAVRIGEHALQVVRWASILAVNNLEYWLHQQAGRGKRAKSI